VPKGNVGIPICCIEWPHFCSGEPRRWRHLLRRWLGWRRCSRSTPSSSRSRPRRATPWKPMTRWSQWAFATRAAQTQRWLTIDVRAGRPQPPPPPHKRHAVAACAAISTSSDCPKRPDQLTHVLCPYYAETHPPLLLPTPCPSPFYGAIVFAHPIVPRASPRGPDYNVVPFDHHRVMLRNGAYINASWLDRFDGIGDVDFVVGIGPTTVRASTRGLPGSRISCSLAQSTVRCSARRRPSPPAHRLTHSLVLPPCPRLRRPRSRGSGRPFRKVGYVSL